MITIVATVMPTASIKHLLQQDDSSLKFVHQIKKTDF